MNGEQQLILMELLEDREYTIKKVEADKLVVFSETEGKEKNIFLFPIADFWTQAHFTKEKIKDISSKFLKKYVQETGSLDCIIVCPQILFPEFASFEDDYLEVISEQTISFNPRENKNVPRHTKAPSRAFPAEEYPIISLTDPLVRWYGFKKGDVIQIDREYCEETYYRIVS